MLNEKNFNLAGQYSQIRAISQYDFVDMCWKAVPKENCSSDENYLVCTEKQLEQNT